MQVKEIMTYNTESISANSTVSEASQQMKKFDIACMPVSEGDKLVGMITDRDIIVRCLAEGKNPSTTQIKQIMTPKVFHCYESDDIHDAAEMMEEKSVHRLVVLDSNNKPSGFVSLADFAVKSHHERLAWEILEKISEPACPRR